MAAITSSWKLPVDAPIPKRARRGSAWRPYGVEPIAEARLCLTLPASAPVPMPPPETPQRAPHAARKLSLARQLALGLGIFAGVLAASVPLAFISEGLAIAVAVGLGAVLVALLARRLLIAPMVAALLAVLGAFVAAHSIHVARTETTVPIRLAELAPSAGLQAGGAPPAIAIMMPAQAQIGGQRVPLAGWVFPAALFALWAAGLGMIRANRLLVRWLLRKFGDHLRNVHV